MTVACLLGRMRHAGTVSVALLALLDAHPDGAVWARPWLVSTLRANLPGYDDSNGDLTLRGWSVGAAWGNETLVQSRPIVRNRDIDPIDDLLRTPASCVVAAFSVHSAARDGVVAAGPSPALSRYRRWLGVRVGAPLPAAQAAALRTELPSFLERHQTDRSDGELVFLSFLAQLHALEGLGKSYDPPELIRKALTLTMRRLELEPPHNLMVSDGRTFAMMHQGGALSSFEPPQEGAPARFRVAGQAGDGRRTNLLLLTPDAYEHTPRQGGERVAEGVFTIDARTPRIIER
jgi:hypothetical protein